MIDFSKSYSLSEQMSVPITEDFFGAASKEHPELPSLHLPPPNHDIISSVTANTAVLGGNNNLLFDFSAPQGGLDLFGLSSTSVTPPSMETNQAEILTKVEEIVVPIDVFDVGGLNAHNEFDIFTPVAQNAPKIGS